MLVHYISGVDKRPISVFLSQLTIGERYFLPPKPNKIYGRGDK